MSKSKSQISHFKKRCASRIGFELSDNTIQIIVRGIQGTISKEELFNNRISDIVFLEAQSNRITKWQMKYNEKIYHVIYDKQRKTMVTILFPEEEYLASII